MSQEIDERVVEMRFDNAQFERNTRQSIKTLNELNESLKLEGAEKGFEKIDDAAAKVDFDRMQSALDSLNSKFSAVEVMGVTALVHITNQAIDTGERLVKSLSVDQVASGWNKYAQKTASVQTIMNATGKSITKVNGYLEKLMWFSDETSYGFTDMTSALSTLTSAGGDIEKMIPMIMGMANATAYAGKGAAEFQRVIYNLAQSYGTGAIQLIDWKSVEQAGVASQQLKQLLIDTGVELGKIKKGAVTTGSFDNSLQKKWADQQVMETAFGKYAEFAEAVKAELDANPNKYHNQASLAIEAIADQYDEVTVKAFKAAQEAKSFSEAVDATKDAVSSGWMETFDILFGNYEEAKGFWSDLAEEFWTMFAGGAAGRNNWLKSAFDSGLDQLLGTEGFGEAGDNYTNLLRKALVNQGLLSEEGIEEAGSFQKALEESGVTAQQLYEVLGEAAEHYHQRAAMSDKELNKLNLDRNKVDALANAYDSMAEQIQNGSVNLDDLAGKMNQLSGREHFFNGILNILDGINSVLEPTRDAFGEVFMTDGSPLYNFLKGFDELTGKMALSEETAEKVQKVFTGVFRVLSIGLKGVKTVGKTAFTILRKLLDLLSPMGDLLLNIGSYIGNLLTWVDVSLGQAESLSDVLSILVGAVAALVSPIADVVKGVKTLVRGGNMEAAKKQFGAFGTVVDAVGSVLDKFKIGSVSAGNIIGTAFQLLGGILLGTFEGAGALIGRAFNGFKGAGDTVSEFADSKVPLLENIRDVVQSLPEKAEKALADFGGTLTGIMTDISSVCRNALSAVKDFFNLQDGVDLYRLLALIDVGALAAAIYGATVLLKKASDNFKNTLANPIGDFFKSLTGAVNTWTKAHTTSNLATAAKAIATAVALISGSMYLLAKIDDPMQAVQALASVISELFGMVVALKVLAATDLTGLDTAKLIGTIVAISIGMVALTNTVAKLGKMDAAKAEKSVEAVGHIAAMLAGMTGLLALFNKQLGGVKRAGGFVAAAAAVDMIALALIPLAKAEANGLDIDGAVKAINGVAIAISILTVAAGFAQKLAGKADVSTLDKIIKYLVKLGGILIAINAMGTALLMAAGAVAIFASLGDRMMDGIRGAGLVVSGIAALLVLMANTKVNPLRMKKGAESMVIASASLLVMAAAVKQMGKAMETDTGGAGMAGVSLMLIGLAGALYLLGKQAPESTAAAVAMVAMGAAMIEMALAIKMLADVDILTIVVNLAALGLGLSAIVALSWALPAATAGITGIAGACLTLATALLMLAPACYLLSGLSLEQALAGFTGMLGILVGLGLIGSAPPIATGLTVFAASLVNLGKAFSAFAGGLVKLSIAAGILAVLSLFADPVCQAIIEAGPDIQAALETIIDVICNTINDKADVIAQAIANLIIIVLDATIQVLNWAWEQLKAWIGEKGSEVSKLVNPLDPTSWVDTFTAKDRAFGAILNGITDPFLAPFGTSLDEIGNQIEDSMSGSKQAVEDTTKALEENRKQVDDSAVAVQKANEQTEKATAAVNAHGIAVKKNTDGLIALTTETGEVKYVTEDMARAMLNGEAAMTDAANASGTAAGVIGGNAANVDTSMTAIKAKTGEVNETVQTTTANAVEQAQESTETSGGNLGEWLYNGFISKIEAWFPGATSKIQNAVNSAVSGVQMPKIPGIENAVPNIVNGTKELWKGLGGKTGLTDEDYDEDAKKDPDTTITNPTAGKKTKSTGKKKTVAEQIEEKYKAKLQANKTLREIADNEYELWLTENQYSADADTLLAKKAENAAAEIKNQTDRVAIAQQKYDEMAKRWGKDKQETKDAYNDLLEEKTNLSKLKADQYTNLFEDVAKRYDANLDTLEKEYSLWSEQNDSTATKLDKLDRETEYQTDELAIKQKKLGNAQQQYDTLKAQYGESDLRTIEAYNDLLDARKDALEIQNDLAHKELDRIDIMIENLQTAQSRMQSRMDILSTVYGDGSLSEREDAYKQAVEEYGKDSEQARKAQFQGTTSAILGTVTALKNLTYQMQQTIDYQKKFDEVKRQNYAPDSNEYKNAESDWLSSKSSFIGFASNLADALNMEDTGKRAMLIFANSFQEHYDVFENAFNKVLDKVKNSMSAEMQQTFSDIFGVMQEEGFTQMGTEFISTISSALQGDLTGALASAFAFAMDFAFSDTGKQIQGWFKDTVFPAMQKGLGQIANSMSGDGGLVSIFQNGGQQIVAALSGGGGVTEAIAAIGPMLSQVGTVLMSFLSQFWWVFLIVGAIAALIGGIAWYVSSRKKKSDTVNIGEEFDKEFSSGIEDNTDKVNDAVTDMTEDAVDIAKNALSTINKVMDDEYDYTPQITPVVDLTEVTGSAEELNSAFDATAKAMSLDDNVTRKMASQIEAQAEIQNGIKAAANNDTLNAINALGEHVDGVADSIRGMKMTIDGKKTIGYIDSRLGSRAAAKAR